MSKSKLNGNKIIQAGLLHTNIVKHMTNSTLQRQLIQAGSAFAGLAVTAGALGSHLLKDLIDGSDRNMWETAVRYHLIHSVALLILGIGLRRINDAAGRTCFVSFVAGIFLFSGCLYLQASSIIWAGERVKWFGTVVPFGGVSFIAGWFYLAVKGYKPSTSLSESSRKVMEMQKRKTKTLHTEQ